MHKKEEYNEILEIAVNRARNSFKHFFELLGIDPELFNHLYDIEIIIDYDDTRDDRCAAYDGGNSVDEQCILLYNSYIESLFNVGLSKQNIIDNIAVTLVHEMLHANRCIYINDCISQDELVDYKEYVKLTDDVDVDMLDQMLSYVVCDEDYFNSYVVVPIKVDYHGDNAYTVYAYNKLTNQYCIYENQKFNSSDIHEIASELNNNRLKYNLTKSIPYNKRERKNSYVYDAAEYYHQENITNDIEVIDSRLNATAYLEECLVEVLAQFILYSRKANKLNLDAFMKSYGKNVLNPEYSLAADMLRKMGMGVIMWFMLSSYDDYYDDKLYKIYNDKYDELLDHFVSLITENDEIEIDRLILSANEIIDKKLSLKK